MRTLLALAVLCLALPARSAAPVADDPEEDMKLHMELPPDDDVAQEKCMGGAPGSKCGGDASASGGAPAANKPKTKCGKVTFSVDKEKKDRKLPKDQDLADLKYDKLKHSKLEEIDEVCYKRRLAKKKLLEKEEDYEKLGKPEKMIAKKLGMLDKAGEIIDKELSDSKLPAKAKNKLKAAKKELMLQEDLTRSKCRGMKSALKC